MQNPAYYGAEDANPVNINLFLSQLIEDTLHDLTAAFCMEIEADFDISPTGYSKIASYYYLNYRTIRVFKEGLSKPVQLAGNLEDGQAKNKSFASLLRVLSDAHEYDELPVRHNEDLMNKALEKSLPLTLAESAHISGSKHTEYDDPHCKAFLLLQVHLDRLEPLPCSDYVTDTNSVLDQSIRILQAMVDFCVLQKSLSTSLGVMNLMQCIKQARWSTDSTLLCLPHVTQDMVASIRYQGSPVLSLSHLAGLSKSQVESAFSRVPQLRRRDRDEIIRVVQGLPVYHMTVSLSGVSKKDGIWTLEGSQKYDVTVDLKRVGPYPNDFKIYAPKFNKAQFEGWWIVFGDEAKDELLELKRVSPSSSDRRNRPHDMSTTFKFVTPADSGHHQFKIFLVSDGYLGLDQEADIRCVI